MKKLLVILSAILFTGTPVLAQDATLSFPEVIAEPGTEVLLPLNITDLNGVGASSIYIQFDPAVLTYIGIENSSFTGMLSNLVGDNEIRTSWFSLAAVDLSEKVYDVRFIYNGGSSDVVISFAQLTDALTEPYDIATLNGLISDGLQAAELELTSPFGGEQWLAGSIQNITWNSTEVTNVTIEYSTDAGENWNTVVSSTPSTGTYEWTVPETSTEEGLVRISDSENAEVNDQSESNFTILPVLLPPVVGNIPDQTVAQCESFEIIRLDDFVTDGDDDKSAIVWTNTGSVELLVNIDKDRNAVVTVPNSEWSGSETITFTATDPEGASASDEVVFTVTSVNTPPEIVCPPDVTLELVSSGVTYSGPSAEASDYCDAEPVVTSEPALPVSYTEPGEYTIVWTATDADGNSASCEQTITVTEKSAGLPLAVNAGPDKEVSCGESVQIGGSPTAVDGKSPYTYLWTPSEGLDDPSVSNPVASPSVATTYTVKVTDSEGTVLSDNVNVSVNDTEAPEVVCPGDITLELTQGSSVTYSGPQATASDNCDAEPEVASNPALPVSYNEPGEYTIVWTATDASGNSSSCEQTITVVEQAAESNLVADAGSDKEISCGESVQIGGSPTAVDGTAPYTYLWTPSKGLDDPSGSNPVASPSVTTSYTVEVTDNEGTVKKDEVTVTVSDTEAPLVVCPADAELEVTLFSSAKYNGPSATAVDNCDPDPVITSDPALPVSYTEPGEYTIVWTATDASGNSSNCDQRITVVESEDVPESNLALLSLTLSELTEISTGEGKLDHKLEKAAENLEKSLGRELWRDENHLVEKNGKKVFDGGKKAVKDLQKISNDKNVEDTEKLDIENVIENLLDVYYSLALISIHEDESDCFDDKCSDEIEKRYDELAKAEDEIAKGKPDKAIDRYKKAWTKSKKKKDKKNDHKKKRHNKISGNGQGSDGEAVSGYSLNQNYPNPFNPTTLISFLLSEAGPVRLVVYNTIGEEINVLADGIYSAGYHTVQFNAENLNAGFYLYRLETSDFVSVKKMLLIK